MFSFISHECILHLLLHVMNHRSFDIYYNDQQHAVDGGLYGANRKFNLIMFTASISFAFAPRIVLYVLSSLIVCNMLEV